MSPGAMIRYVLAVTVLVVVAPTHAVDFRVIDRTGYIVAPTHAVDFRVIDRTGYITGCNRFRTEIGEFYARQTLKTASRKILLAFNETSSERKGYGKVTLIIQSFGKLPDAILAKTSDNTIRINANYLQHYPKDARVEFTGIIIHEMTHVWQNYGNGLAPRGLIHGIADYMRLKSGWAPKEWVKVGSGTYWDEGFAVTAYFLDYCNGLKDGFVADLNKLMKDDYSDEFFMKLLGKPIDEVWMDYKSKYALSSN